MNTHRIRIYAEIAIIILGLVLIYLSFLLVREYQHIHVLDGRRMQISELTREGHNPLTASDAKSIALWMTFDFINHAFHISPEYLQNALGITDTSYPDLSLERYARTHGLDSATVLATVQTDVGNFMSSQSQPPTQ